MTTPEVAAQELLARRRARESLEGFAEYVQPPDQQPALHHRFLMRELETTVNGGGNLIVMAPPGSAKSTYSSVILPAYFMGKNPALSVIAGSHTLVLAERFGRRTRNLLQSDEVKALWNTGVAGDSAAAGRWSTSAGGEYLAAGVGGSITGFRADLGIIDDPVKSREEADSDLIREKTWDWFVTDFRTRMKPGGRIILVLTRWHEDDLAGRLLDREGDRWRVVKLPMEAGADDPLGRKEGERLWADWFTDDMIETAKLDARAWSSLYQQDPRPKEGAEFKRSWIQRYSARPKVLNTIILVDPASGEEGQKRSKKGQDFTSMWVVGLGTDDNAYVLDLVRDRLNLVERIDILFELHRKYKPAQVRYERYGMAADVQAIKAEMERRQYRFVIREVGGQVSKVARIRRLIWWFENGRIWFPAEIRRQTVDGRTVDMLAEFVDQEYAAFPVGAHDDAMDALARLAEPNMPLPWPKQDTSAPDLLAAWGVMDQVVGY